MAPLEFAIFDYWLAIDGASSKHAAYLGENMSLGYDIFRESSDGSPLWIAEVATLEEAEEKLHALARSLPAKYFVRDATNAKIVGRAGPTAQEEIEP